MVESLFQDVRYAVRSLTRAPLLACVTVLTLPLASVSTWACFRYSMASCSAPGQAKGTGKQAGVAVVSARFFDTLGIPILRGRAFARAYWPGEDPVGKLIELGDGDMPQIVGVARDTRAERFGTVDGPRVYRLRSARSAALNPMLIRFAGDAGSVARSEV
jgi:hypothetical protein